MADTPETTEGAPSPALVKALRHLLRPLVGLLLRHRITHRYFSELLKGVYVETAEREFALDAKRQTDSRISLLTGVHRKDVRRLRDEHDGPYTPPASVSLGARLVARWTTDAAFLDDQGRPRPLVRTPSTSGEPGFEELVAAVSTDIRARAVLDEWKRLGVVEIDGDDRVCLIAGAFIPERGFEEKVHFFGRNLHDHVTVASNNLGDEASPSLERSVHYGQLSEESVAELTDLGRKMGMDLLQTLNRRARDLQQRDEQGDDATRRFNFGVYQLDAPDESDDD